MVARSLVKWPSSSLLEVSDAVVDFDASLLEICQDLVDTMTSNYGAGLAAVQIGCKKSLFVLREDYVPSLPTDPHFESVVVVVNPKIEVLSDEVFAWEEACLSVDDISAKVNRSQKIKVEFKNSSGETIISVLENSESASFQHESDHLLGKLFIHRLSGTTRSIVQRKLRKKAIKNRAQQRAKKSIGQRNSKKKRK